MWGLQEGGFSHASLLPCEMSSLLVESTPISPALAFHAAVLTTLHLMRGGRPGHTNQPFTPFWTPSVSPGEGKDSGSQLKNHPIPLPEGERELFAYIRYF
jgi:hypothetical protein